MTERKRTPRRRQARALLALAAGAALAGTSAAIVMGCDDDTTYNAFAYNDIGVVIRDMSPPKPDLSPPAPDDMGNHD